MTTQAARGFTIIEVMLFLAVTGMLTVGVLVGSSTAIAQQRYRDSVNSLKSFIQEQYGQTTNVVNSDASNPVCKKSGNSLVLKSATLQARGTSECLLLGRYLLIEPTKVTAYDVIGQAVTDTEGGDDIAALKNYVMALSDTAETADIAWGASIVKPKTATGLTTSVLILRSPLSGSVVTFVSDGNQKPAAMLDSSNMVQKDLCVDPAGGVVTSQRMAVRINARATSQSAVEVPLEKDSVCD
jgi:type II secretory pathway pseudopilin PulG